MGGSHFWRAGQLKGFVESVIIKKDTIEIAFNVSVASNGGGGGSRTSVLVILYSLPLYSTISSSPDNITTKRFLFLLLSYIVLNNIIPYLIKIEGQVYPMST